jgi:chromosome partitioning protein
MFFSAQQLFSKNRFFFYLHFFCHSGFFIFSDLIFTFCLCTLSQLLQSKMAISMNQTLDHSQRTPLRNPGFKKKLIEQELLSQVVSDASLRQKTGKPATGTQTYTPFDVRTLKLAISGQAKPNPPGSPPDLPPRFLFMNNKGGVGKTTQCGNIATAFAFLGYSTCVIDADPQGTLTALFGVNPRDVEDNHIGSAMLSLSKTKAPAPGLLEDIVVPVFPNGMLDLIPSTLRMAALNLALTSIVGRETLFGRLLEQQRDFFGKYDVILIDCGPSADLISQSMISGATTIVCPVLLDYNAVESVQMMLARLSELNSVYPQIAPSVEILMNQVQTTTSHAGGIANTLLEVFPELMCPVTIARFAVFDRQAGVLIDNPDLQGTHLEKNPTSVASKQLFALARYLASNYGLLIGRNPATLQLKTHTRRASPLAPHTVTEG